MRFNALNAALCNRLQFVSIFNVSIRDINITVTIVSQVIAIIHVCTEKLFPRECYCKYLEFTNALLTCTASIRR